MLFAPFYQLFPEVAEEETRVVKVLRGANISLPVADYSFIEMFCDERNCDCRRVFFNVVSTPNNRTEAVIAWGWGNSDFYRSWLGMDDPRMLAEMQGPVLNLGSPKSENAQYLLEFFSEILLSDAAYVDRVKRHYAMFRSKIDAPANKPVKRRWKR